MSGFNTSTRNSDETSFKLKAQAKYMNLRNAKDLSKKLEIENIKMEDRLRELKLAMTREKEERERKGGGFWSKGQTGTLNNYATEVLEKSKSKKKEKGIKVLKDEPIVLPERSNQPGTMKYIAQRPLDGKENKPKVLKCGQCEERSAALSCQQCSEHYCTRCFAAFHIKGALKKHRTIPITAMGPRQSMSPRPLNSYREYDSARMTDSVGTLSSRSNYQDCGRNGPDGASGSFDGPSLMAGVYNEAESAASFQQALVAWRTGKDSPGPAGQTGHPPRRSVLGAKKPSPRNIVVSPVKSPVYHMESSTSTTSEAISPDIHFHSDVSYAERLLLKKHRRTELPTLPSIDSVTPTRGRRTGSASSSDQDEVDYEPVSFTALYQASCIGGPSPRQPVRAESGLSIIELDASSLRQHPASMEYTDQYQVEEVEPYQAWEVENLRKALSAVKTSSETSVNAKPPSRGSRSLRKQSRKPATSREDCSVSAFSSDTTLSQSGRNSQQKKHTANSAQVSAGSRQSRGDWGEDTTDQVDTGGEVNGNAINSNEVEPELQFPRPQSRPVSTRTRPVSTRSRPPSARVKSAKSRPASRAASRAKSRVGEGVLTKAPNISLREVACREDRTEEYHKSPLTEFFTIGVETEFQERTVTPSGRRPPSGRVTPSGGRKTKESSYKVSNKLYQMAPCSWKPESSLEKTLPPDSVSVEVSDALRRVTESGQTGEQTSDIMLASAVNSHHPNRDETGEKVSYFGKTPLSVSRQNTGHGPVNIEHPFESGTSNSPRQACSSRQNSNLSMSRQDSTESARFRNTREPITYENSSESRKSQPGLKRSSIQHLSMSTRDALESERIINPSESLSRNSVRSERLSTPELKIKTRHSSNVPLSGPDSVEAKRVRRNSKELSRQQSTSSTTSDASSTARQNGHHTPSRQDRRPASQATLDGRSSRVTLDGRSSRVTLDGRSSRVTLDGRSSRVTLDGRSSRVTVDGRTSRAIVVDGEDMSKYDNVDCDDLQEKDDNATLEQLEWELASQSGRVTADGQISRMSMQDDLSGSGGSGSSRSSTPAGYFRADHSTDLSTKLRVEESSDEMDENDDMVTDRDEVRALH